MWTLKSFFDAKDLCRIEVTKNRLNGKGWRTTQFNNSLCQGSVSVLRKSSIYDVWERFHFRNMHLSAQLKVIKAGRTISYFFRKQWSKSQQYSLLQFTGNKTMKRWRNYYANYFLLLSPDCIGSSPHGMSSQHPTRNSGSWNQQWLFTNPFAGFLFTSFLLCRRLIVPKGKTNKKQSTHQQRLPRCIPMGRLIVPNYESWWWCSVAGWSPTTMQRNNKPFRAPLPNTKGWGDSGSKGSFEVPVNSPYPRINFVGNLLTLISPWRLSFKDNYPVWGAMTGCKLLRAMGIDNKGIALERL